MIIGGGVIGGGGRCRIITEKDEYDNYSCIHLSN
jgi:hypothetical protein